MSSFLIRPPRTRRLLVALPSTVPRSEDPAVTGESKLAVLARLVPSRHDFRGTEREDDQEVAGPSPYQPWQTKKPGCG